MIRHLNKQRVYVKSLIKFSLIFQVSLTASSVFQRNRALVLSGVVTWLMSSDISQLKPSTSPSRMSTNKFSWAVLTKRHSSGATSSETWDPVVLLELLHFASSIHWITPVLAWVLMSARATLIVNTLVSLIVSRRHWNLMAQSACTVVSASQFKVSSSTVLLTSVATILLVDHCQIQRTHHSSSTSVLPR